MSEITRFDVYGKANYSKDGSLVLYDHHEAIVKNLERQLKEATSIVAGMDIYIEAECHEAWANNYEIRESAFVDMAKKLKQLKEQGE